MDIVQGADFRLSTTFVDKEGNAINLATSDVRVIIKENPSDLDGSAVAQFDNTTEPEKFEMGQAANGRIVARVSGSYFLNLAISEVKKYYIQLEAKIGTDEYYRSEVKAFTVGESLFKS